MTGRLANGSMEKPLRGRQMKSLYLGYVTSATGGKRASPLRLTSASSILSHGQEGLKGMIGTTGMGSRLGTGCR